MVNQYFNLADQRTNGPSEGSQIGAWSLGARKQLRVQTLFLVWSSLALLLRRTCLPPCYRQRFLPHSLIVPAVALAGAVSVHAKMMDSPTTMPPAAQRVQLGMQSPPNIGGWYGSGFAIGGTRHNSPRALTGDIA